ncbi:MAG: hypothetical protein IPO23_02365 [Flavobacterium sp.]|nr:hypothetical protein [Flavobacterium sp.]
MVSGPSTLASQFSSLTNPTAVFTPAGGVGSYVVRWTISNSPCTASTANATITVGQPSKKPPNVYSNSSRQQWRDGGCSISVPLVFTPGGGFLCCTLDD